MAKRFTDTEKWDRPWYRNLPHEYRELFNYILDKCDIAGLWYVDLDMASYVIGSQLDKDSALKYLNKQITIVNGGCTWFVHDFVCFQYGELNMNNNLHRSVYQRLIDKTINMFKRPNRV